MRLWGSWSFFGTGRSSSVGRPAPKEAAEGGRPAGVVFRGHRECPRPERPGKGDPPTTNGPASGPEPHPISPKAGGSRPQEDWTPEPGVERAGVSGPRPPKDLGHGSPSRGSRCRCPGNPSWKGCSARSGSAEPDGPRCFRSPAHWPWGHSRLRKDAAFQSIRLRISTAG